MVVEQACTYCFKSILQMKLYRLLILLFLLVSMTAGAQMGVQKLSFTRADSLRGGVTSLRTCYDINYYHLDVKFDIGNKSISGSNLFKFTALQDFTILQFDLFANLGIEKIVYKGMELPYKREYNAVFVTFPKVIKAGSKDEFTVYYSGHPTIAKKAPWDGGVVFTIDSLGNPWVATACQGIGASIWWPNKDQQFDEVDSVLISVSVPDSLQDVSNGRLRKVTALGNGYTKYDWFVANPINNYDIEANIGKYTHFSDSYDGEKGKLSLDYWVLTYNLEKAKAQFGANVKDMLKAFEYWFGPYPFYEDGYKLVETPYLGMEHQSGTAYGNGYKNGYRGTDLSGTGWGLKWDYIIVHESGHEWFGNNITAKDIADEWIHESFTDYAESLFIESRYGKQAGQEYVKGLRLRIKNDAPSVGFYNVNNDGSQDMYPKGSVLLNTVRTIIDDDEKWRSILRGLNKTFYHQTVTYNQIVNYISEQSGNSLGPVFDQYLKFKDIPTLVFKSKGGKLYSRWIADVKGFNMPVRVKTPTSEYRFITPKTEFAPVNIPGATKKNLEVDTFNYYIKVRMK